MVNLSLNELELKAKNRGIKGYKSILDASESVKTVSEIRKENHDEDIIFGDLRFLLDPQKDHYEPKKLLVFLIITIFNMKVWEITTKIYQSNNILMVSDHI